MRAWWVGVPGRAPVPDATTSRGSPAREAATVGDLSIRRRRAATAHLPCAVLVALAGCATLQKPPATGAPAALPTAAQLQGVLEATRQRVRGLRTLADSEIEGPEGRFRASEVLLIEPPHRLRIEVLSTFGVAWILATDGEVLDVYSRQDQTVYRGRPTRDLIDYYLPVPLALEELTELLLGRPPRRDVVRTETVSWEPATGLVRLPLRLQDGGRQTVWFDGRSGVLKRCEERDVRDNLRFDLRVGVYRQIRGEQDPADLTIVSPLGVRVRLQYANTELNPEIPPRLFRIPHVAGTREAQLDAGGR
jgi:outer membrane lipoprotein-sorting protein